jgi:antitoxin ParD1/3/4
MYYCGMANFAIIVWRKVMSTMNISLPDQLKSFVDERVNSAGYGTSSEYLRELIRRDQDRVHLRALMLDAATSEVSGEANKEYFEELRSKAKQNKK